MVTTEHEHNKTVRGLLHQIDLSVFQKRYLRSEISAIAFVTLFIQLYFKSY